MNRIDRLNAILIQLQSKKIVRAAEISERFNISLRTVYRDVKALQESGVPIGAEAGTGYYIVEGYHLPPVMFSKEEAAALLTGEKIMATFGDKSTQTQFTNAMQKIRAVLRGSEKDFLESLEENIAVLNRNFQPATPEFPNRFLSEIQYAIAHRRITTMHYVATYNNSSNTREIAPIGVFYLSGSWHLIAYCLLRNDYRDFRIDRIKQLTVTDKNFNKDKYISLQTYISKQHQMPDDAFLIKVRFSSRGAQYMRNQKQYYGFIDETILENGEVEMQFLHSSIEYFGRWILPWMTEATVIQPQKLMHFIRDITLQINQQYQ
ncbi:putative DNA-binding transcriptional regulator YafY [Chitinophaga skermanii]|uniref:Putative DNA-binding transcriptional regulator YafY n=1 Tax=Chitinophaga skermanii TaxID=331697 RepID=A0A327QHK6_9BACT|nr:YafY family protein [Chitinophaga skermanii]RAJ04029.1 putative DNA-binding transcriptional regulator YafY [Chitinophaga skermanii]